MKLFPSKEKKIELLTRLRLLDVKNVQVHFQGGGDEGHIDYIEFLDYNGHSIKIGDDEKMDWEAEVSRKQETTGEWKVEYGFKPTSLEKILEQVTLDWLDAQGLDWYNDNGGQGNMTIDFNQSPPLFELDTEINIMSTEDHYDESEQYDDEEEWGVE